MTLRDRFQKQQVVTYSNNHTLTRSSAELLIEIADEFAIEFAEWCAFYIYKSRNVIGDMLHAKSKYDDMYTSKELLEIFKKEKGL